MKRFEFRQKVFNILMDKAREITFMDLRIRSIMTKAALEIEKIIFGDEWDKNES